MPLEKQHSARWRTFGLRWKPGSVLARTPSRRALVRYAKSQLREALGLQSQRGLRVEPPPTPPRSGAIVLIAKANGHPVAVFKVMNDRKELSDELASNAILRSANRREISPPQIYSVEEVLWKGRRRPTVVMEYIPRNDLEALIKSVARELRELSQGQSGAAQSLRRPLVHLLQLVAQTLGVLHSYAPNGRKAISQQLKNYEVEYVKEVFFARDVLAEFVERGTISIRQKEILLRKVRDIVEKYQRTAEIPGAFVHGDAHPGNIILDAKTGRIRLIDTETMMWSVEKRDGKVYGIGDPINDVGRSGQLSTCRGGGSHPSIY